MAFIIRKKKTQKTIRIYPIWGDGGIKVEKKNKVRPRLQEWNGVG